MNLDQLLFVLETYKELTAINKILEDICHEIGHVESFVGKIEVYNQLINLRDDAYLAKKTISDAFTELSSKL